jgi:HAAS
MNAADRLTDDYLARLDSELAGLPRAAQREVIGEIEAHITEARADLAPDDEIGVRNLLDRLGDPAEIASEARKRFGVPTRRATSREIGALILLPLGFVFAGIGWLIGLFLLWSSDAWNSRDKLIGTLVIPGGLFGFFLVFAGAVGGQTCYSSGPGETVCSGGMPTWAAVLVTIVVLGGPLFTEGYLIWRLTHRTVAHA